MSIRTRLSSLFVVAVFILALPAGAWANTSGELSGDAVAQEEPEQPADEPAEPQEPVDPEEPEPAEPTPEGEETAEEDVETVEDISEEVPAPAWTVLNYSLTGGAIGAISGTGLWLLSGRELSLWLIPQLAAAGIIVGAGVGTLVLLGQDREPMAAPSVVPDRPDSVDWVQQDTPDTVDFTLFHTRF